MRISDWSSDVCSSDLTQQSWLWSAPARHSTKQIGEVFERIELLYALNVHKHLDDLSGLIVRRYARRLASRPPSVGARIKEPARTVEVGCFLRHCLFTRPDQAILMVQRSVAALWRSVAADCQSVVEGRSVSVGVDVGGRGVIQNKIKIK